MRATSEERDPGGRPLASSPVVLHPSAASCSGGSLADRQIRHHQLTAHVASGVDVQLAGVGGVVAAVFTFRDGKCVRSIGFVPKETSEGLSAAFRQVAPELSQ